MSLDKEPYKIGFRPEFLKEPIIYGREITISMPNGETRKAKFALVPMQRILASHNEETFADTVGYPTITGQNINDRNYKDDPNAQAKVIHVAQNLDPNILVSTSRTPSGTPIITTDGIVVSGNNRVMSIKRAFNDFPSNYAAYWKFMNEEAFAFGIDGRDMNQVTNPVLVRIDYDFPAYNTTELSKYNKDTKKTERPIDKAIKLGKILSENENCKQIIGNLVGEYETFSELYSNQPAQRKLRDTLVDCNIITTNELAAYFDDRGFTESGKDLIENMLAGLVLEKEALVAGNLPGGRQFRNAILTSLPVLTRNVNLPEGSLKQEINEAFILEKKIHDSGLGFKDYMAQGNMFDEKPNPRAVILNRLLASGRNNFKQAITAYNDSVISNQGESLFGDKPTPDQIFEAHITNRIDKADIPMSKMEEIIKAGKLTSDQKLALKQMEMTGSMAQSMAKPEQSISLSGDQFFSKHPEKILGEAYTSSGRFGPVTKYRGTIEAVDRIDAPVDFLEADRSDNPTLSSQNEPLKAILKKPENKANLKKAVEKTRKEAAAREVKRTTKPVVRAIADHPIPTDNLQSFQDIFSQYNPGISKDELQVFVWYKEQIGQELSGQWYAIAGITQNQPVNKEWINKGLLCYFRGELIPAYMYYAGNIWEKRSALSTEKDQIIQLYGKAVYEQQELALQNVFKVSYDKRLTLTDRNQERRLKILPISKFSNQFMIKTLVDGKEFKAYTQPASGKNPGRPDFFKTIGKSDYRLDTFLELSLTEAFEYWLTKYTSSYEIKKDTDWAEIITIYIHQRPRPRVGEDEDKKAAEAAWQRKVNITKEEGDRLFSEFLAEWILPEDILRIETEWNEKFNGYLPMDFNKIPGAFSCAKEYSGSLVDIRPEKRDAVAFLFNEGSGCLAYDVGVGKTWSALFAIKQFMDAGWCKRPVIVVPNQVHKQFLAEGKGLLPDVKFNDLYNLSKDYIEELRGPDGSIMAVDEGSISVLTYEGLERIGFSDNTSDIILNELYAILDQDPEGKSVKSIKKKDKSISSFRERLALLVGRGLQGTLINIEDLGFDFACYDEAHKMKKVFVGVRGEMKADGSGDRERQPYQIQSGGAPSSIALKGFMLTQYLLRNNHNRNILTLTATPFTNSPLEIYSVLSFLANKELEQMGIKNLKTFFDTYVHATNELTINSKLKPERKQIVKGFNNLQSLQQLVRRFILYKTGEQVNVPRPNKWVLPLDTKVVDGQLIKVGPDEVIDTTLPLSAQQKYLMEQIKDYAEGKLELNHICSPNTSSDLENIEEDDETSVDKTEAVELDESALNEEEKKGVRVLRAMSFARNLALSPYLYECSGLGEPTYKEYIETSPKLLYIMQCIATVKKWHEDHKTPVSGQVIYMDRGVDYFHLIKEYLVKEIGFKEHEVGIIKSQMPGGKGAKEAVKMKFLGEYYDPQSGEKLDLPDEERMKVVIGSGTIKEGINLQKHSTVLYNAFVDWNPTDIKQLEGRIWRQGNLFNDVRIVTPLMEDSMDVFIFQKLEEKTSRIAEIWDTNSDSNTFNLEEFNPSEIKAALIRDPKVLAEMQLMGDAEKLKDDIRSVENEIKRIDLIIEDQNEIDNRLDDLRKWVEQYRPNKGEPRSLATLLGLAQEVLKTQKDAKGLIMPGWYERRHSPKPGVKYSELDEASKPYWFDDLNLANRNMIRVQRDYLGPRQLTVQALPGLKKKLEKDKEALEKQKTETVSEEAIKNRAKVIEEERQKSKKAPPSVMQRVHQFASLNHLLANKKQKKQHTKPVELSCPPKDPVTGKLRIDSEALEHLNACIAKLPQTKELHTDKDGNYTPERKKLHDKIIAEFTKDLVCIRRDKPIAVLTGGAPGSGKSHFIRNYAPYLLGPELFHVDADEVRKHLPEYEGWNAWPTQFETRDIVNQMLDNIGGKCKYDVVYDGTMNNAKRYFPLINRLKKLGYDVYVVYMDVPQEVSQERALERYQRTGRYVPMDVIQETFDVGKKSFNAIKKMVSGWILVDGTNRQVIDRGGDKIPEDRNYAALTSTENFQKAKEDGDTAKARKLKIAKAKAAAQAQRLRILLLAKKKK